MSLPHCRHCRALLTPGAPFCMTCFHPLEDEPPVEAPVPVAVGAPAAAAPDPANDFFAAPPPQPQYASHPGQGVDWRVTAPTAALLTTRPRRSRRPVVALGVVGALLLVGGFLGAKAMLGSPSEKETFATAFREARPPDFIPAFPDLATLTGGYSDEPEAPGEAKAFVETIDPQVRAANDALVAMQRTLDGWADGDVSDEQVRAQIRTFLKTLDGAVDFSLVAEAPASTQRGLAKLTEAITGYRLALGALQDWMDSRGSGSRLTFRLAVGTANADWDSGLVNLYRAAGLKTPPLPHPQQD